MTELSSIAALSALAKGSSKPRSLTQDELITFLKQRGFKDFTPHTDPAASMKKRLTTPKK
jgi:hypothetical protein